MIKHFKEVKKHLKDYKLKNEQHLYSFKKIFMTVFKTLKTTGVLLLILFLMIMGLVFFDILDFFGTNLYFSYILLYLFIVYIIVNLTFVFKNLVNEEYNEKISIGVQSFKKLTAGFTLVVTIVFILLFSYLQLSFIDKYVNPPLIGCSYYDEYGNLLFYESTCDHINVSYSRNEDNTLREIKIVGENTTFQYQYDNHNIVTMNISFNKNVFLEIFDRFNELSLDRLEFIYKWNYSDTLKEEITVNGFAFQLNKPVYQLLYSSREYEFNREEMLVRKFSDIEMSILILLSQEETATHLTQEAFNFISQYNDTYPHSIVSMFPELYNNYDIYLDEVDSRIGKYMHDISEEEVSIYSFAYFGNYDVYDEFYQYTKMDEYLYVLEGHHKFKFYELNEDNQITKIHYDHLNKYNYRIVRDNDVIYRIDQLKDNEIIKRNLFSKEPYGFRVLTYSYIRNGDYSFKTLDYANPNFYLRSSSPLIHHSKNEFTGSHVTLFYQREPLMIYLESQNWKDGE